MAQRKAGVILSADGANRYISDLANASKANKDFLNSLTGAGNLKAPDFGNITSGLGDAGKKGGSAFGIGFAAGVGAAIGTAVIDAAKAAVSLGVDILKQGFAAGQYIVKIGIDYQQAIADIESGLTLIHPELSPAQGVFDPKVAKQLKDSINSIAIDPKLVADFKDVSGAAQVLTRFGISVNDITNGALRSAVLLQNAVGGSFELSSETLAKYKAINNLGADQLNEAANQISATVVVGAFRDLNDYRYALTNAGGAAVTLGLNQSELNTILAVGNKTLASGRVTGTEFRAFLDSLTPSSKKATAAFKALNLNFADSKGNFIGIGPAIAQVRTALSGLTNLQKAQRIEEAFGVTAGKFLQAVLNSTTDDMIAQTKAIIENADAQQAAAIKSGTLGERLKNTAGQIEAVFAALFPEAAQFEVAKPVAELQDALTRLLPVATAAGLSFANFIGPLADQAAAAIKQVSNALAGEPFIIDFSNIQFGKVGDRIKLKISDIFTFDQTADSIFLSVLNGALRYAADNAYVALNLGDLFSFINDKINGDVTITLGSYTVNFNTNALEAALSGFTSYIQSIPSRLVQAFSFNVGGTSPNLDPNLAATHELPSISPLVDYIKALPNQITVAFTGLTLPDIGALLKTKVDALPGQLSLAFTGLTLPDLGTLLKTKIDALPGQITTAFTSLNLPNIADLIKTKIEGSLPASFTLDTITFPDLGKLIKDKVAYLLPTTFTLDTITFPDFGKLIKDKISALIPANFSLDSLFPESANAALGNISSGLEKLGGAVTLADMALKEISADNGALGQLRNFVTTTVQGISDAIKGIDANKAAGLGLAISGTITSIVDALTSLSNLGNANLGAAVKSLTDLTTGVINFATGVTTGFDAKALSTSAGGFVASLIDEFTIALAAPDLPGLADAASGFVLAITNQFRVGLTEGQGINTIATSLGGFITAFVSQAGAVLSDPKLATNLNASFQNLALGITGGLTQVFSNQDLAKSLGAGTANLGTSIIGFIGREIVAAATPSIPKIDTKSLGSAFIGTGITLEKGGLAESAIQFGETYKKSFDDALLNYSKTNLKPGIVAFEKEFSGLDSALTTILGPIDLATKGFEKFTINILKSLTQLPGIKELFPQLASRFAPVQDANRFTIPSPQTRQEALTAQAEANKGGTPLAGLQFASDFSTTLSKLQAFSIAPPQAPPAPPQEGHFAELDKFVQISNALSGKLDAEKFSSSIDSLNRLAQLSTTLDANLKAAPPAQAVQPPTADMDRVTQLFNALDARLAAGPPPQQQTFLPLIQNQAPTANDFSTQMSALNAQSQAAGATLQQGATESSAIIVTGAGNAAAGFTQSSAIVVTGAGVAASTLAATPPFPGWGTVLGPPINLAGLVPIFPGWSAFITPVNLNNQVPLSKQALGFARGTGYVPMTGSYMVGERGPEIVTLARGSGVIPHHRIGKILGAYATGTGKAEPITAKSFLDYIQGKSSRPLKIDVMVNQPPAPTGALGGQNFLAGTPFSPNGSTQSAQATQGAQAAVANAGLPENTKTKISQNLEEATTAIKDAAIGFSGTLQDLNSELKSVPGLFGASPVTQAQMDAAKAGIPQNFADDFVRQLGAEVANKNQEFGNLLPQAIDALTKAGITPGGSPEAILAQIKDTFASGQLFSNPENLNLINAEAVKASIATQEAQKSGQANITAFFDKAFGFASDLSTTLGAAAGTAKTSKSSGLAGAGGQGDFPGWTGQGGLIPNFPGWAGKGGLVPNFPGWAKPNGFIPEIDWSDFIAALNSTTPAAATTTTATTTTPPKKAAGANNFRGGSTIVGENGPELVQLGSGARIFPNGNTRKIFGVAAAIASALPTIGSNPTGMLGGTTTNIVATIDNQGVASTILTALDSITNPVTQFARTTSRSVRRSNAENADATKNALNDATESINAVSTAAILANNAAAATAIFSSLNAARSAIVAASNVSSSTDQIAVPSNPSTPPAVPSGPGGVTPTQPPGNTGGFPNPTAPGGSGGTTGGITNPTAPRAAARSFSQGMVSQPQTQVIYQRNSTSQAVANNTKVFQLSVNSQQASAGIIRDFQTMQVQAGV